jgi:arylsulfatase A-like enzyme
MYKIKWLLFGFFFCLNSIYAQRNVILIIADDLGSDYCGFYDNHLDTCIMPNVRKLLAKGVMFSKAWSNPLCSPTRSGILTGRYSFRTGVGNAVGGTGSAVLDTAEMSIPKMLNFYKPNGIAKANIGKWHLQLPTPTSNYIFPNKMGYDRFEGNFNGLLSDFYNWTKVTNGVASNNTNYATTETVNNAVSWINTVPKNKPFFLWLAFNAPHTPYHLPPANLHSYASLTGTAADITANPKTYFKAMVEAMDKEMGRLFDSLLVNNRFDSTDIIFIGDNGDNALVAQTPGGAKGSVYQEGVSVPFIISGPSVVNPNRVSDALVNTHDLFATILELFGYKNWSTKIANNKPVDSKSLWPILKNSSTSVRPWVFTEIFKNPTLAGDGKTMRNLNYKLIDFDNGTQKFFNLTLDPNENNDLLKGTLSADAQINYNYLCNEMTNLTGKGGFCSLGTGLSQDVIKPLLLSNPFSSTIAIRNCSNETFFELTNAIGELVYAGSAIDQENFSYLSNGIYFLKVVNTTTSILKLIKAD